MHCLVRRLEGGEFGRRGSGLEGSAPPHRSGSKVKLEGWNVGRFALEGWKEAWKARLEGWKVGALFNVVGALWTLLSYPLRNVIETKGIFQKRAFALLRCCLRGRDARHIKTPPPAQRQKPQTTQTTQTTH